MKKNRFLFVGAFLVAGVCNTIALTAIPRLGPCPTPSGQPVPIDITQVYTFFYYRNHPFNRDNARKKNSHVTKLVGSWFSAAENRAGSDGGECIRIDVRQAIAPSIAVEGIFHEPK